MNGQISADKVDKHFNTKERSIFFAMNKVKVNLSEEKINFMTDTYQKELKF